MRRIVFNDKNLRITDVEIETVRVKGIVINSNNEVLLAHNNNTYQFIGGHVEQDETKESALVREIREETGITNFEVPEPFMLIENYMDHYFSVDKNVHSKIYYYRLLTDDKPDMSLTDYDMLEKQTDFKLFYVNIYHLKDFLKDALAKDMIEEIICKEMLLVVDEFINLYGGDNY